MSNIDCRGIWFLLSEVVFLKKLEIINRESFFVISVNLPINYWKKRDSYDTASN